MGMDVYGVAPANDKGEYFRRNVWGWHPLWQYCEDMHPSICAKVTHGHSNDGDGLNAEDAAELSALLFVDIELGDTYDYVFERDLLLMLIPDEPCQYCDATGVRTDTVGVCEGMPTRELDAEEAQALGRTHGWCNACLGKGTVEPWARNYSLSVEDVREFAVFLSYCGGFQIC